MKSKANTTYLRLVLALGAILPAALLHTDNALAMFRYSDSRLKDEVETLDGSLAKLRGLHLG